MKKVTVGHWDNNPNEETYLKTVYEVLTHGDVRSTRNGNTRAIFAQQMRFNLQKGFPAPSTKKLAFKSVLAELLWFIEAGKHSVIPYRLSISRLNQLMGLKGDAYNPLWSLNQGDFLYKKKAQFPDDCGVIYGSQWRNFNGEGLDQLQKVISALKNDPFSRYHVMTAWNPLKVADMCLPPCHMKMQFFVRHSRRKYDQMHLDLAMDQRSCDMFLGVPFNIASYAILLHMVAQCVYMVPGELIITLNDCHIYSDHLEQVRTQLARDTFKAPKLHLNPDIRDIDDFTMNDVEIHGYKCQDRIQATLL